MNVTLSSFPSPSGEKIFVFALTFADGGVMSRINTGESPVATNPLLYSPLRLAKYVPSFSKVPSSFLPSNAKGFIFEEDNSMLLTTLPIAFFISKVHLIRP